MKGLAVFVWLLGLAGAIYVGGWLLLVGGIVNLIDAAEVTPTNGGLIAWGLIQVLLLWWMAWLGIMKVTGWLVVVLHDAGGSGVRRGRRFENW
jgi:hypothetical protein